MTDATSPTSPATAVLPAAAAQRRNASRAILAAAVLAMLPLSAAVAQDDAMPAGFETEPVLRTSETRDKDPLRYPTGGTPEITAVIASIEPGGRTPLHEHPVPTFVYVLEGEVELETEGGDPHPYGAGGAYIEALDREHQLFNRGDATARLLVVFVGEQGVPTTVTAEAAH